MMTKNEIVNRILTAKVSRLTCDEGSVQLLRELTPEIASAMLECMPKNQRKLRPVAVEEYARAMNDHRWLWTGDAIRFTTKGHLVDGQHRLSAVVASGVTVPDVLIVILNDGKAILALDQGRVRHMNDLLKSQGKDEIEGAIASAIMYDKCDWISWRGRYSPAERAEACDACPLMPELGKLKKACKVRRGVWISGPIAASIRVMKKHKRLGYGFFHGVFSGTGLVEGVPCPQAKALSEHLINNPSSQNAKGYAYIAIRAFNAYREDKKLGILTYHDGWEIPAVAD